MESVDDPKTILRRVGIALIVFGCLDIGYMIYCIADGRSYSSIFNFFAVISGIYVWRGHPWYLKWVTRAAAFCAAAMASILVCLPFLVPFPLQVVTLRLHPVALGAGFVTGAAVIAFMVWVYRQLRLPAIRRFCEGLGQDIGPPRGAMILGIVVCVAAFVGMKVLLVVVADDSKRATGIAESRFGPSYRYWVSSISASGNHGRAHVLAYDEKDIKSTDVDW